MEFQPRIEDKLHFEPGAMRGIEADGSGCSAWIHLGLVEKAEADPQFLAFKETLQCVRLCQNESQLGMLIDLAIQQNFVFPAGMPTQALVFRLQYVGWTMQNGVNIRDSWGVFFHERLISRVDTPS